jgi:hypothetical protein
MSAVVEALATFASEGSEESAIHAGEWLAEALRHAPPVSLTRLAGHAFWMEAWAACAPLSVSAPVLVQRKATLLEVGARHVLVDPCIGPANTPLAERMASLLGAPPALAIDAIDPLSITDVVLTTLQHQSLRTLLGTTHGDGVQGPVSPMFPNARVHLGAADWKRALRSEELAVHERALFARLRDAQLVYVNEPVYLAEGLVIVPTPGLTIGNLSVACRDADGLVHVVSSNVVTRDALSPYESTLPGLLLHTRLRDIDVAPRGDVFSMARHFAALRLERHLSDRDPNDPRFQLIWPSSELLASHMPTAPTR